MKLRNLSLIIVALVFLLSISVGCAKRATKGKMIGKIESRTYMGMPEEEFKKFVPSAELVDEEGNKKLYAVVAGDPCFICGSGKAFQRSYEIYATTFTFEDGKLVSTDRIVSGK